jgi:hypothetical protein
MCQALEKWEQERRHTRYAGMLAATVHHADVLGCLKHEHLQETLVLT